MDTNNEHGKRCEAIPPLLLVSQGQAKQMQRTSPLQRVRVRMVPQEVSDEEEEEEETLAEGQVILAGRYRIVQLLYKRPRLRLYLARRISSEQVSEGAVEQDEQEPLVALRELVLTDLPERVRKQVEKAALEEFISPIVLGPSQHSKGGDRAWNEGERHYLVMQLHDSKKSASASDVITLDKLLLEPREWPTWLNEEVALSWGARLCRMVARLHRLGVVLGDLDLSTILVSSASASAWSPILLASWPPPPLFWPEELALLEVLQLQRQIFPIAHARRWNAFSAPEMLSGSSDERSDVYSLGAILYLLLTHYAPIAPIYRLQAIVEQKLVQEGTGNGVQTASASYPLPDRSNGLELIAPHLLYHHIPTLLEHILVRALEIDPARRYPSVFALVETLEAAELEGALREKTHTRKWSARKMFMRIVGH